MTRQSQDHLRPMRRRRCRRGGGGSKSWDVCMLIMSNGTPKLEVHAAMVVSTYTHSITPMHTKVLCVRVCAYQPARAQDDPTRDDTCRPEARRPQEPRLGGTWSEVSARRRPSRWVSSEWLRQVRTPGTYSIHTCVRACLRVGTKFR